MQTTCFSFLRADKRQRRHRGVGLRLGLCALFLLPPGAQAGQGGNGPVTLLMKYRQGEVLKYQMNMSMSMAMQMPGQPGQPPQPMNSSMIIEMKVMKALPGGGAEVEETMHNQQGSGRVPPMKPFTMTFDAHGKVLSMKGLKANDPVTKAMQQSMASNGTQAYLPSRPVKVGESWTQKVTVPAGPMGTMSGTMKCTLVKVENVGKYRTAHIKTVMPIPISSMMNAQGQPTKQANQAVMSMSGSGTVVSDTYFAIAEGRMVQTTGTTNFSMKMKSAKSPASKTPKNPAGPQEMSMTMNMKMSMNLLP
jgi:hypothetical protein